MQEAGSGEGGRQRKASAEPSLAPRPKKVKSARLGFFGRPGSGSAPRRHGGGGLLSFEAARTFARTLELRGHKEWSEYSKGGKRPSYIPGSPDLVYRDAGWTSWHDWLGNARMARGGALSFEAAAYYISSIVVAFLGGVFAVYLNARTRVPSTKSGIT